MDSRIWLKIRQNNGLVMILKNDIKVESSKICLIHVEIMIYQIVFSAFRFEPNHLQNQSGKCTYSVYFFYLRSENCP